MTLSVIARKLRSFLCWRTRHRFYVLNSEPNPVESEMSLVINCFTTCTADLSRVLRSIKCHDVTWAQRFRLGHSCYVASSRGEAVCYVWASPRKWHLHNVNERRLLAADVVFLYDVITVEKHRGKRALPTTMAYAMNDLRYRGYLRNCTLIEDRNVASQRCFTRVGYLPTDNTITIYRLFKLLNHRARSEGPPHSFL